MSTSKRPRASFVDSRYLPRTLDEFTNLRSLPVESSDFDWQTGKIVHWDLGALATDKPLELQYDYLKEDLAQIEFGSATLLDVGWYPSFSPDGVFVVSVVHEHEWDEPELRLECRTVSELHSAIRSAIAVAVAAE
jgi:hypothetical protein